MIWLPYADLYSLSTMWGGQLDTIVYCSNVCYFFGECSDYYDNLAAIEFYFGDSAGGESFYLNPQQYIFQGDGLEVGACYFAFEGMVGDVYIFGNVFTS
jgi:hypothetical protein